MDAGQLVLAHLLQGILGEDASNFLAALLVGKVQLAAQSRVELSQANRAPFYVFADEFQNYETSALDKLINRRSAQWLSGSWRLANSVNRFRSICAWLLRGIAPMRSTAGSLMAAMSCR